MCTLAFTHPRVHTHRHLHHLSITFTRSHSPLSHTPLFPLPLPTCSWSHLPSLTSVHGSPVPALAYLLPLPLTCICSRSSPALLIPARSCSIALLRSLRLNCARPPAPIQIRSRSSSLGRAHLFVRVHLRSFTDGNGRWRPFAPVRARWQFRPLSILPAELPESVFKY